MSSRHPTAGFRVTIVLLVSLFQCAPAVTLADPITEDDAVAEIIRLGGRIQRNKKLPDRPVVVVTLTQLPQS